MQRFRILFAILLTALTVRGADPTDTSYSFAECCGSAMPYPAPEALTALPDSLTPVFLNHVGRHGARFISSPNGVARLLTVLHEADSASSLTPKGKELMALATQVMEKSHNYWGALDDLGRAEQRGIASRMLIAYGPLFQDAMISAISSYSPRCVMSMYEFTHQLDRLNNHMEILTSAGRQNSPLMRFFDTDREYYDWLRNGDWREPYDMQQASMMPAAPARRLFAGDFAKNLTAGRAQEITADMFHMLQGIPAMGLAPKIEEYFTRAEANAAWSCTNLRHYLQRTATTISSLPSEAAAQLLVDLIVTTDSAAEGKQPCRVMLRFGHAETLMPLLSLMRLRGCYYLTTYFDTVSLHWRDFEVVPMAANLQMLLARTKAGKLYMRFDLNERPIPLIPNSDAVYIPWDQAREYLLRCVPLHLRP